MKLIKPNFKINNYPMYGLNRYRSFMHAPTDQGQPMYISLETEKDVEDFCSEVLYEYDCPESAFFAVFNDGRMKAYMKNWDEEKDDIVITCVTSKTDDPHLFSKLDGEMRFCCYNLIIEQKPGQWMIQS